MALEQVGYNSPEGCIAYGVHREVLAAGSTRTLLADQSGALVLLDTAAGSVVTLPTPVVGMQFEFNTTVSVTSNSHKVVTAAATEYLVGGVISANLTVGSSGDFFVADGTTHVAITSDGATTGGLVGGGFRLTAISTTQWSIEGLICGSGTNADPFATS